MAPTNSSADWRHACTRGAAIGLVLAAHLAIVIAVLVPAQPGTTATHPHSDDGNVLHIVLLAPPPRAPAPPPLLDAPHPQALAPLSTPRVRHRDAALRATPAPPSASSAPGTTPGFIAGGGFMARLHAAQTAPATPRLPGGHHYLASDLQFVPAEQQSIAGKVHRVAGFLLGWYDPACKNTRYELAKPRAQQLADSYTTRDLEQRLRDHHCE